MAEAAAAPNKTTEAPALQWLALTLTPGLGPTKARRLVDFFGSVQAVFLASLTELEATGIQVASAQSLGTGRSLELAQDELARVAAAGVRVISLDDPGYPSQLKQIYDPPLVLYVRGNESVISQPGMKITTPATAATRDILQMPTATTPKTAASTKVVGLIPAIDVPKTASVANAAVITATMIAAQKASRATFRAV